MRPSLRRAAARSATAFIGVTLLTTPIPTVKDIEAAFPIAGTVDNKCWNYKDKERGFARKMNGARVKRDQGRLSLDPELSRAARIHTREMIDRDLLYHTTVTNLRNRVSGAWTMLGENVGVGGTVSSLHQAFMESPAHRHNILYPTFRHVGVGVVQRERLWVTVLFSSGADPGTTLRMPRC